MTAGKLRLWRYVRLSYVVLFLCWLVYAAATLLAPIRQNAFSHVSHPERLFIQLTIIVIFGIIWFVALRGATAFKNYASLVQDAKEAPGLHKIANGLLWVVAYLVLIAVSSAIVSALSTSSMGDQISVLRDHLTVLVVLIAFINLYMGSQHLAEVAKFDTWDRKTMLIIAGYMLFSIAFVIAFSHSSPPPPGSTRNSLSILPHDLLLFTLILPYLIGWFLGILACVNISRYAHRVKGILYRRALVSLVRGIVTVIALGIVFQLLTFAVRYLTSLPLNSIILLLYALIVLYGLGFVFIRSGAKMLARIEVAQ
jgi:hypothetical protein